jgi:excisionase family DNA binding protein
LEDIKIYTAEEAAGVLRVSLSEIYKLVKQGELVALRIGRRVAITHKDLIDFIDRNRTH